MSRRVYKFMLKTLKEVSFVGTRYYPVDLDPSVSPYATVLATVWDEDHMVGQVNQTEILAWWSEVYQQPSANSGADAGHSTTEDSTSKSQKAQEGVLLARNP
ncbi:MAG TPA: hypothetical protein VFN62_12930 [Acidobacteriaceae bacterium]|nr:hypothetical protein [Acidobacteriaceae bacterium]